MDRIGAQLQMTKNVHGVIQVLLTAVQALNGFTTFVPAKFQIWVAIGILILLVQLLQVNLLLKF
jgi:hypothetical protein